MALAAAVLLLPLATARASEVAKHYLHLAQVVREGAPRVTVAPNIVVEPATRAPLPITVGPADALPNRSFLRLRGLPPTVSLSDGHAIAPGAWAIPLNALPGLHLNVPTGASGKSDLSLSLVGEDGQSLAEATAALIVAPAPVAVPPPEKKAAAPIASPPPPQRPKAPVLTPEQRESAEKMLARGEQDLEGGNIALARQFLLRAAEAGLAKGALLLAATYDPRELARMRAQGIQPNPALARKWYERAKELGAPEAEERLARLAGG
jgi:hypothetical protein